MGTATINDMLGWHIRSILPHGTAAGCLAIPPITDTEKCAVYMYDITHTRLALVPIKAS